MPWVFDRQQAPGDQVVDRGAGERQGAERGLVELQVGQDAGQHRKGGDRQGRADEHGEGSARDVGQAVQLVQHLQRQDRAQQHGQQDADAGDGERQLEPGPQMLGIDPETDQEHEEDQPDLRQQVEERLQLGGKQRVERGGRVQTEQRRSQDDAGHDLSHHRRLPEALEEGAHAAGEAEHQADLQQDEDQLVVGHRTRYPPRGRRRRAIAGAGRQPGESGSALGSRLGGTLPHLGVRGECP